MIVTDLSDADVMRVNFYRIDSGAQVYALRPGEAYAAVKDRGFIIRRPDDTYLLCATGSEIPLDLDPTMVPEELDWRY